MSTPDVPQWEKIVTPPTEPASLVRGWAVREITVPPGTTPAMAMREALFLSCLSGNQDITIYFGPPLYIMSPRIKVYRADQIMRFKGYLHSFQPVQISTTIDDQGNELPTDEHTEMELTIKVINMEEQK